MALEKLSLFTSKKEFFTLLALLGSILFYSLLIEYHTYKDLKYFDYTIVDATVLSQYKKTKTSESGITRRYHILKLKADAGYIFYTNRAFDFEDVKGKKLRLILWPQDLDFMSYMRSFYGYSRVLSIEHSLSLKEQLEHSIEKLHPNEDIATIYKALYLATPMSYKLYSVASNLGISHLFALSGFHLGVLGFVLFFLFKYPYKFLQNRYFPHRSYKLDSFVFVSVTLLVYLLFLDAPASLLRAFVMLVVGFYLYDRGYKIISMQTLLLTVLLILSFFPRLFFALGFWLSVAGVFYIFLFLLYFKHLSTLKQFLLIPIWVYLMMLPYSLFIFENFSFYHPLSVLWTSLFTLFYPLSIFLHLIGFAGGLDFVLELLLDLGEGSWSVRISAYVFYTYILSSLLAIGSKPWMWVSLAMASGVFLYAFFGGSSLLSL